jgi:hypothetical protein
MYDALAEACERAGYQLRISECRRGWSLRVLDPTGAEVCRTLVGDPANLEAAAINVTLYLKPFLSLERSA